jgi:hypothetical protein
MVWSTWYSRGRFYALYSVPKASASVTSPLLLFWDLTTSGRCAVLEERWVGGEGVVKIKYIVTYAECVSVALIIQQAKCMHCTILSSVACLALPYFSTLSHNDPWEKELLNIKSVFWFSLQLLPETFLILRRMKWNIIKNVHRSSHKVPVILLRF